MADLFNQTLTNIVTGTKRAVFGTPGTVLSEAENITEEDLRDQIADEMIPNATEKTTLVDADEFGISDSEDSFSFKAISWANIRAALQSFFEVLRLTTKGDLLVHNGSNSDRLPVGSDDEVLTADSTAPNGVSWKTGGGGGGGGHTYNENGVAITQRTNRNILTNGSKTVLVDDAVNDETEENWYFEVMLDIDPTGKQDGDALTYNGTSEKIEPTTTATFDNLQNTVEANLNADGQLSTILQAGYRIDTITVSENNSAAAGNISIGSTALGNDIVNAETVGADADFEFTILKNYFSRVNDTDLYISSSAWGSGSVTLYFTFKKL